MILATVIGVLGVLVSLLAGLILAYLWNRKEARRKDQEIEAYRQRVDRLMGRPPVNIISDEEIKKADETYTAFEQELMDHRDELFASEVGEYPEDFDPRRPAGVAL